MLAERLQAPTRCPSARLVGRAIAKDYRVDFDKPSIDGSAKAALRKSTGYDAFGVLFQISMSELDKLDRAEGAPKGYTRTDNFIVSRIGANTDSVAITYLPNQFDPKLSPYDWYLALVLAGALKNELPIAYIESLRANRYQSDPDTNGNNRLDAIAAMKASGCHDWTALLAN
jgi:gamma-glutamylcyclotransferase